MTLEEELRIVEKYLEIEHARLGERLQHRIDVDPALGRQEVPVLSLQPLVENAIKHAIAPKVEGGSVAVRGWREGDLMVLTVLDDGDGTGRADGTGEGLENVRQRLAAMFGDRASVTLTRGATGTEARLVVPLGAGRVESSGGVARAAGR